MLLGMLTAKLSKQSGRTLSNQVNYILAHFDYKKNEDEEMFEWK